MELCVNCEEFDRNRQFMIDKLSSRKIVNYSRATYKRKDFHIHSTASDGDLTPSEIVELARMSNIDEIAITDHDTLKGTKEILKTDTGDVKVYSGVELTALVKNDRARIHILGYDFDVDNELINRKIEEMDSFTKYNFLLYVSKLKDYYMRKGLEFPYDYIRKLLNEDRNISRNDLANKMIEQGLFSNHDEAFDNCLNPIRDEVQEEKRGLSDIECIQTIKNAGGIVSLAHPSSLLLSKEELEKRIVLYKLAGLDAIEVFHPNNSYEQRNFYLKLAKKYDLLVSGGSDYHGMSVKADVFMGSGRDGNLDIREDTLTLTKSLKRR